MIVHTISNGYLVVSAEEYGAQIAVFEEQQDLITLEAGKTYVNDWSIEIHQATL